jgi:hypothetical protein
MRKWTGKWILWTGVLLAVMAMAGVAQAAGGSSVSQGEPVDPDKVDCIGGIAWFDGNLDGVKDVGEDVMDGARVDLYAVGPFKYRPGNLWRAFTVLTHDGGRYEFCGLASGPYFVKVDPPAGILKDRLLVTYGSNPSPVIEFEKGSSWIVDFGFGVPHVVEGSAQLRMPPR